MQLSKIFNFWYYLCALIALLPANEVMAQPKIGPEVTIAVSVLNFGYKEFDDNGTLLDREDGLIPGAVLSLSHTSNRWVFAGDISYHGGEVVYDGQTNTPTPVPIKTRTAQNIADLALRSEYWLYPRYAHYLGAGYHHWDRDILPGTDANGGAVGGLFESYAWGTFFIGAKAVVYESRSANWLLDARLLKIIKPTMTVRLNSYDSATLSLGERPGFRVALPWRYTVKKSTSLNVEPYAETFELGRSATTRLTANGAPAFDQFGNPVYIYEPLSQTVNYGLTLGISQHF